MHTRSYLIRLPAHADILQDVELHESVKSIDDKFAVEVQRLMDRKWKAISDQLAERLQKKKFTSRSCRERFEGLIDGTAELPFEIDPDKEARKARRDARIVANRHRRAEEAAEVERAIAEKAALIEAKKAEDLRKEQEKILKAEQRAAEKAGGGSYEEATSG